MSASEDQTLTMEQFLGIWFDLIATGASLRLEAWAYRTHAGMERVQIPKSDWEGPVAIELFAHEFALREADLERLLAVCRKHNLHMLVESGDEGHKIGFGEWGSGRFIVAKQPSQPARFAEARSILERLVTCVFVDPDSKAVTAWDPFADLVAEATRFLSQKDGAA